MRDKKLEKRLIKWLNQKLDGKMIGECLWFISSDLGKVEAEIDYFKHSVEGFGPFISATAIRELRQLDENEVDLSRYTLPEDDRINFVMPISVFTIVYDFVGDYDHVCEKSGLANIHDSNTEIKYLVLREGLHKFHLIYQLEDRGFLPVDTFYPHGARGVMSFS